MSTWRAGKVNSFRGGDLFASLMRLFGDQQIALHFPVSIVVVDTIGKDREILFSNSTESTFGKFTFACSDELSLIGCMSDPISSNKRFVIG